MQVQAYMVHRSNFTRAAAAAEQQQQQQQQQQQDGLDLGLAGWRQLEDTAAAPGPEQLLLALKAALLQPEEVLHVLLLWCTATIALADHYRLAAASELLLRPLLHLLGPVTAHYILQLSSNVQQETACNCQDCDCCCCNGSSSNSTGNHLSEVKYAYMVTVSLMIDAAEEGKFFGVVSGGSCKGPPCTMSALLESNEVTVTAALAKIAN
jgi:hypothetical protein